MQWTKSSVSAVPPLLTQTFESPYFDNALDDSQRAVKLTLTTIRVGSTKKVYGEMFQPQLHFSLCHIFIVYWFLFIRPYLAVFPLSKNK